MDNHDDGTEKPRRRLRIPAALAVAFVGTSASLAMTFAGCSSSTTPEPVDAGQATSVQHDGGVIDGEGSATIDAMIDAGQTIADAPAPPPDAPKPPVDAYVPPPDAPHT